MHLLCPRLGTGRGSGDSVLRSFTPAGGDAGRCARRACAVCRNVRVSALQGTGPRGPARGGPLESAHEFFSEGKSSVSAEGGGKRLFLLGAGFPLGLQKLATKVQNVGGDKTSASGGHGREGTKSAPTRPRPALPRFDAFQAAVNQSLILTTNLGRQSVTGDDVRSTSLRSPREMTKNPAYLSQESGGREQRVTARGRCPCVPVSLCPKDQL